MSMGLALLAALAWGGADFLARLAADRIGTRSTVLFTQGLSALLLAPLLLSAWGGAPTPLRVTFVALALLAGVLNALGTTWLYEGIRRGPVSLVSPIASSFGAIAAVLAILGGEQPSNAQLVGLAAISLGVVGSNLSRPLGGAAHGLRERGITLAVLAALAWGTAFYVLTPVFAALGPVLPVLISRIVTVSGHAGAAAVQRQRFRVNRGAAVLLIGISVLDTGAFLSYGAALEGSMTSLVCVTASLFSTVTIALAWVFLGERLRPMQWIAIAILLVGVALVSS
ncbi:MAG: DMT family transporter [Sandaracinaceae bacterium]|nr:MAG: DMT family transporter [Sandaracinaceae bacterium]